MEDLKQNVKYNILVTSIGSFSADCAVNSLREITEGKIIGCDIYPKEWHSVSSAFDEVLRAPLVKSKEEYFTFVKELCRRHAINIIIPLTDLDVDFFCEERQYFADNGIMITIGNDHFLSIARDKIKLDEFFMNDPNIKHIKSYSKYEVNFKPQFPMIAKPKNGRSSEGIFYINSKDDLNRKTLSDDYIFQEIINGTICTVDYVRSQATGRDFCMPRKELIRTKNGAGITVQTFKSEKLQKLASYVGNKLNVIGTINMEFISNDGEYYLIDINPRFSAGVGFSKLAGYDFVKSHLQCFFNKDISAPTKYKCMIAQKVMVDVINVKTDCTED